MARSPTDKGAALSSSSGDSSPGSAASAAASSTRSSRSTASPSSSSSPGRTRLLPPRPRARPLTHTPLVLSKSLTVQLLEPHCSWQCLPLTVSSLMTMSLSSVRPTVSLSPAGDGSKHAGNSSRVS